MVPPKCFQDLDRDDDLLQPSQHQLDHALASARTYWYNLANQAKADLRQGILNLHTRQLLRNVPPIPAEPVRTFKLSSSHARALAIKTSSIWRISAGNSKCNLDGKEKEVESSLWIGLQVPIKAELSGECFHQWPTYANAANYLAVMALAWSYVLSVRTIELQGGNGARVFYTKSVSAGFGRGSDIISPSSHLINFDVGWTKTKHARWWAAVVAPEQGWQAIVSQQGGIFQAPWAVSLSPVRLFSLNWESIDDYSEADAEIEPLTAQEAFEVLTAFSASRELNDQLLAALAVALTLPTHSINGIVVRLLYPRPITPIRLIDRVSDTKEDIISCDELARCISLSCNIEVILSSLCAMFWNENVSCNLVSPWLHSILNEIPLSPDIKGAPGYYYEILSFMCARRCPSIFPLCIGAAISGLLPFAISHTSTGVPSSDPVAFPWTGCPQSFMDLTRPGRYYNMQNEEISRADVWQICYLPALIDDGLYYRSRPLAPWKPPGKTYRRHCELRVQAHWDCERHCLYYQGWGWKLMNGQVKFDVSNAYDTSFCLPETVVNQQPDFTSPIEESIICDHAASRNTSQGIFQWTTINGEGIPQEKVYHDEWLHGILEDNDDSSLSQPSSPSSDPSSLSRYANSTTSNSNGR